MTAAAPEPLDESPPRRRKVLLAVIVFAVLVVVGYLVTGMPGMDHSPSRYPDKPTMGHEKPTR